MGREKTVAYQTGFTIRADGTPEVYNPAEAARRRAELDYSGKPTQILFGETVFDVPDPEDTPAERPKPLKWTTRREYVHAIDRSPVPRRIEDIPAIDDPLFTQFRIHHTPLAVSRSIPKTISTTAIQRTIFASENVTAIASEGARDPLLEGTLTDMLMTQFTFIPGKNRGGVQGAPYFASAYTMLSFLDREYDSGHGAFYNHLIEQAQIRFEGSDAEGHMQYLTLAEYYANADPEFYESLLKGLVSVQLVLESYMKHEEARIKALKEVNPTIRTAQRKPLDGRQSLVHAGVEIHTAAGRTITPLAAQIDAVRRFITVEPVRKGQVTEYKARKPRGAMGLVMVKAQLGIGALVFSAQQDQRFRNRVVPADDIMQRLYCVLERQGYDAVGGHTPYLIAANYYLHTALRMQYKEKDIEGQPAFKGYESAREINPHQDIVDELFDRARHAYIQYAETVTLRGPIESADVTESTVDQTIRGYQEWKSHRLKKEKYTYQFCPNCQKHSAFWNGPFITCSCGYQGT